MNEKEFKAIYRELVDENPFAVRAALKILDVEFTRKVLTLAVTCEERPRFLVNLPFVAKNCRTDAHVKAVICHEFLHVLLRHTEGKGPKNPAEHWALDAVINAVIHRTEGPAYSSMMSLYYAKAEGLMRLLRPMTRSERSSLEMLPLGRRHRIENTWDALYRGRLVADDILELAEDLGKSAGSGLKKSRLLGDHHDAKPRPGGRLAEALDVSLKSLNGSGIWRSPHQRGIGGLAYDALFTANDEAVARWERAVLSVLKRHLLPEKRLANRESAPAEYRMPVLSPRDRRAYLGASWMPFIPEAGWEGTVPRPAGRAQVYLDVSGSMNTEMPHLIALLGRLRRYIKSPFWAFSNEVNPAVIEGGVLKSRTTGGTSLSCVLRHLAKTRPESAVIVTDGYIEPIPPALLDSCAGVRIHAVVSRDGSPALLEQAGIPYTQLQRRPS